MNRIDIYILVAISPFVGYFIVKFAVFAFYRGKQIANKIK